MRSLFVAALCIVTSAMPAFAQTKIEDRYFDQSNCKALSTASSGFSIAFSTTPPSGSTNPSDRDFPLKECLAEVRLAIFAYLAHPDGHVHAFDRGWVEFGEKGALTKCSYRAEPGASLPEDLAKRIFKYENVIPKESPEDNSGNTRELIREWAEAIKNIVVIDCLVS